MGIPTCTNMVPQYEAFLPHHPFINVDGQNLKGKLIQLIQDPELRGKKGQQGREWVERHHDIWVVIKQLYGYYHKQGWLGGEVVQKTTLEEGQV